MHLKSYQGIHETLQVKYIHYYYHYDANMLFNLPCLLSKIFVSYLEMSEGEPPKKTQKRQSALTSFFGNSRNVADTNIAVSMSNIQPPRPDVMTGNTSSSNTQQQQPRQLKTTASTTSKTQEEAQTTSPPWYKGCKVDVTWLKEHYPDL